MRATRATTARASARRSAELTVQLLQAIDGGDVPELSRLLKDGAPVDAAAPAKTGDDENARSDTPRAAGYRARRISCSRPVRR